MTLPRLSLRHCLAACLLLAACADERADDTLEPQDIGASYESLAQASRNPHCRHRRGCPPVDAGCAHATADASAPASGCRLADGAACAPPSDSCANNNGGCAQLCRHDDAGTRFCGCQPGWTLQADGTTCVESPLPRFTVTGIAAKGGSAVASSPTGTCSNAGVNWSCSVPAGGSVVVATWAADTWRLSGWSCPHGVAAGDTMTIANVQEDSDCYAFFMPITFSVSYQAVDSSGAVLHGVVTAYDVARGPCTDDLCRAQQSETVVLTAGPSEGLTFVGWSGCSTSNESELSLVVNADQTCVAHYESSSSPILL